MINSIIERHTSSSTHIQMMIATMADKLQKQQQQHKSQTMSTTTTTITPHDVLCGRGGLTNSHVGNKQFRKICSEYQLEYLQAKKNDKKTIAQRVVGQIHAMGGRFLQQGHHPPQSSSCSSVSSSSVGTTWWVEVPSKKALEKTSQALREGLDVRNKTVRPAKLFIDQNENNAHINIEENAVDDVRRRTNTNPRKRARLVDGLVVVNINTNNTNSFHKEQAMQDEDEDTVPELVQQQQQPHADNDAAVLFSSSNVLTPSLVTSAAAVEFEPIFTFSSEYSSCSGGDSSSDHDTKNMTRI